MAGFNKFNSFVQALSEGKFNLGSDSLKVMLSNTAPAATNAVKSDITDISAGNGYTAGGTAATISSEGQSSGLEKLVLASVTFTAAGGTIGPFRYAALYDDSAASKNLIGYWDYGSSITLNDGETFTVGFDATNGVIQIQ